MHFANIINSITCYRFIMVPSESGAVVVASLAVRLCCCIDMSLALISAIGTGMETTSMGPAIMGRGDSIVVVIVVVVVVTVISVSVAVVVAPIVAVVAVIPMVGLKCSHLCGHGCNRGCHFCQSCSVGGVGLSHVGLMFEQGCLCVV